MKYYSEKLKKLFDSEAELMKAESAATEEATKQEKLRKEREAAAKAIDEKLKEKIRVTKEYNSMLADFCKKYGKYYKTITDSDIPVYTGGDPFLDAILSFIK